MLASADMAARPDASALEQGEIIWFECTQDVKSLGHLCCLRHSHESHEQTQQQARRAIPRPTASFAFLGRLLCSAWLLPAASVLW